jgi:hypothetical protein
MTSFLLANPTLMQLQHIGLFQEELVRPARPFHLRFLCYRPYLTRELDLRPLPCHRQRESRARSKLHKHLDTTTLLLPPSIHCVQGLQHRIRGHLDEQMSVSAGVYWAKQEQETMNHQTYNSVPIAEQATVYKRLTISTRTMFSISQVFTTSKAFLSEDHQDRNLKHLDIFDSLEALHDFHNR